MTEIQNILNVRSLYGNKCVLSIWTFQYAKHVHIHRKPAKYELPDIRAHLSKKVKSPASNFLPRAHNMKLVPANGVLHA